MQRASSLLTLSMLAVILGCGSNGPARYEATGNVTLDGQPLANGRITFRDSSGETASASGPIDNGRYSLQSLPGSKRVEITASREIAGPAAASGEPAIAIESLVPSRYNQQSKLTAEISSSGGNRHDFALESAKE